MALKYVITDTTYIDPSIINSPLSFFITAKGPVKPSMGTRGIWGFKCNDEYKVTYNHYDSYLEGLGCDLKNELKNYSLKDMRERFPLIKVIKDTDHPNKEIVEKMVKKGYISGQGMNGIAVTNCEWYAVLREWQGTMKPYMEYEYPYMCDGTPYASDWIEYSYIIDLDNNSFITYNGYFKNEGSDRYIPVPIKIMDLIAMSNNNYCSYVNNAWGSD